MSGVADSLERLGALNIDPAPEVYARVFARWPEMEALFVRDRDGSVRGHMLFEVIEAVLDCAGPRAYAKAWFGAERIHHVDDLGVGDEAYVGFVAVLRDVVRDALGPAWSADMAASWDAVLSELQ